MRVSVSASPRGKPKPVENKASPQVPLVRGQFTEAVPVQSSTVASAAYNEESSVLLVEFRNGSRYIYEAVPPNVFENLIRAPSPGKYMHIVVKTAFKAIKV